jgi:ribosomal protein S27AE
MATQTCPKCGGNSFTWAIHDETGKLTHWYCGSCNYSADEDESKEMTCPRCQQEHGSLLLRDAHGFHRWCWKCTRFDTTSERFE